MQKYTTHTLSNGLRVFYFHYPHLQTTEFRMFLRGGEIFEDSKHTGISHFCEHMLFKGTKKYPSTTILKETVEKVGGYLNGFTGRICLHYPIKTTNEHLDVSSDVLNELMQNALFSNENFEIERKTIIEEMTRLINRPEQYMVRSILPRTSIREVPLKYSLEEYIESLKKLKLEDLKDFYNKHYNATNMILVVTTNLPEKEILTQAEKVFGTIKKGIVPEPISQIEEVKEKIVFIDREMEQIHFGFGTETFPDKDEKTPTAYMFARILTFILFRKIREEKGLTYTTSVNGFSLPNAGWLYSTMSTKKENIEELVKTAMECVEGMKKDIEDVEIEKARNVLCARLLFAEEDPEQFSRRIANESLYYERAKSSEDLKVEYESVTKEQIIEFAKEYFAKDRVGYAFLGPVDADLKKKLTKLLK